MIMIYNYKVFKNFVNLTKKEYEQKIEEISSLIRIEHEKIL